MRSFEDAYREARMVRWASRVARGSGGMENRASRRRAPMGLSFDVLRDYTAGDDVRSIDWKSSARTNTLMVRSYHEQRREGLIVVIENRATLYTGSLEMLKHEYAGYLGAVVAIAAENCGVRVQSFWASAFQRGHAGSLALSRSTPTRYAAAHGLLCESMPPWIDDDQETGARLVRMVPSATCAVIITDGLSRNSIDFVKSVGTRMPCVVVRLVDPLELELPEVGIMATACGTDQRLDLSYRANRAYVRDMNAQWRALYDASLATHRIPVFEFLLGERVGLFIDTCCRLRWG